MLPPVSVHHVARPCPPLPTQAQLSALHDTHAAQLSAQQEAAARQLAQQLKAADGIIRELEGAALGLQSQLAVEVERADRCVCCGPTQCQCCARRAWAFVV
jgi:hypothetical protein